YPNLPDISDLSDYRPKLPLRVFSAEGLLMGEFGEERRNLTPIGQIPKVMKDAVLAIEDSRFYSHGGVDYKGLVRAALANLGRIKSQGASTITMQVARNVYLSTEKTFTRKLYEVLLTFKLEHMLSKDQILEIYMNQIFLGNRAYGFAAASEAYFGKPMKDLTIAEAAMLAGLPKAPSAYNPISNPTRARSRQLYIIERMQENGFITAQEAEAAKKQELQVRSGGDNTKVHAEYIAETVRQLVYAQYGDEAYTRGLNVFTTVRANEQDTAYRALRKGIMDYERRQIYRGPEEFVELPIDPKDLDDAIDDALVEHPDNGDVMSAVVMEASPKKILALRQSGEQVEITGEGLRPAQSGLSDKAPPKIKIRRGAVIRVAKTPKNTWEITQLPEVEGAFVAIDPRDGAIHALVGGFDFNKNKFNHVTQAWRQPGSGFKPFIYSAALEKGFTPSTIVNDAPLFFDAGVTGGQPWEPKNYDGKFEGPMPLHTALAKSKNMVSIRILQAVG
ncbi:MAG: transglycosylase domain-containing protein, partial [Ramlibacter sp.]